MKNKLNRTFKFGILFLGMTLLFWNCEKNEEITNKEIQQEKNRAEISFEQFKSNIISKEKLQTYSRFFDINKSSSKTTFNKTNSNDFNDATILTDNIIKIKKNDFTSYTFTILTQTKDFGFYNLVLYVNNNQEIYKSHILKYTPSEKWLADTTQHFSGNVKIINNDFLNVDNLLQSKSSTHAKSLANDDCIDSVTTEWVCGAGNNHEPGHPDCRPENNAVTEYVITIEYGPCTDNGDGNGDFDPETGSEGGSTSGGGDGGIVTAPNTVPYTSQLKQFQSGTLNSIERNYYSSDSNIKNTIDRYLIQKNFSNIAKFDAKLALEFSESLNLNFQQFNWVFNNRDSEDFNDITNYLNEIINITPEIEDFIKDAIDALNDDGEVDLVEQVIIDKDFKDNPCLKSVYDGMGKATTFKNYIQNFEPDFSVAHLKFSSSTNLPSNTNAETSAPDNYLITITFNKNNLNRPSLSVARTFIHEIIHAEIFRKLLSVAQHPSIQLNQNQIIQLKNDYPGLYDYYMRWKWNIPQGQNPSSPQHEAMAQHYRNIIKQALEEFDNTQTEQTYNALSWIGLMGSGTFNATTGLYSNSTQAWINTPQNQRLNIINTINTFNSSNPNCQ